MYIIGTLMDSSNVDTFATEFNKNKALLLATGMAPNVVDYTMMLQCLECSFYQSVGYKVDNNPGSIMWNKNSPYPKGTYIQSNGTYLVHFPDLKAYADKQKSVLSQRPGFPLSATSLSDFVARLKANNYFGRESAKSYLAKLKAVGNRINALGNYYQGAHTEIKFPESEKNKFDLWGWAKEHPILASVGALLTFKIVKEL